MKCLPYSMHVFAGINSMDFAKMHGFIRQLPQYEIYNHYEK